MATMLLTTHGTGGDVLPFLRLGAELRRRGHDVTLLTHDHYAAAGRRNGLDVVPIDTEVEYQRHLADARETLLGQLGSYDPAELLAYYRRNRLLEHVRLEYDTIRDRHVPGDTVIVGRHTSGLSALMAAEATGAPAAWIALTPTQIGAMPMTEFLHQRVLAGPMNRLRSSAGLPPIRDWPAWLRTPALCLGLWPAWFDQAGPAAAIAEPMGFLLNDADESGEPDADLTRLLTADVKPILVSVTTGQMARDDYLQAAVHGAVATGRPVIVSSPSRPEAAPDGVHWYPWLPFRAVMPHVAAVVHQGGIGTLGRAVTSGVAQLILGYSFDQPDNGARITRAGAGAWLPAAQWTPGEVSAALLRLLAAPPFTHPMGTPTAQAVADRIESLLVHDVQMEVHHGR